MKTNPFSNVRLGDLFGPSWRSRVLAPSWRTAVGIALAEAVEELGPPRIVAEHAGPGVYGQYLVETDSVVLDPYNGGPSVLIHELAHWTGHPSRLGRPRLRSLLSGSYASLSFAEDRAAYAAEEAIACAATENLARRLGILPVVGGEEHASEAGFPDPDREDVEAVLRVLEPLARCVETTPEPDPYPGLDL